MILTYSVGNPTRWRAAPLRFPDIAGRTERALKTFYRCIMLSWFEGLLNPYPATEPTQPPKSLWAFCLHYAQGAKIALVVVAITAALIAIVEVSLYGFIGLIIDWLSNESIEEFLPNHTTDLLWMAFVLLIGLPALVALNALVRHQVLMGNMPQRIRWMAHRYLLRQSMTYFQDEFAGRIATKLMQTSLAVREVAVNILDMFVFVGVYFVAAIVMAATAGGWFAVAFVVWLAAYVGLIFFFVPRMSKISEEQADARSMMTGQVVDSYTNISTIKLFSHNAREETYARSSMDAFLQTAYRQMRLATFIDIWIISINVLLLAALAAFGISQWLVGNLEVGAFAAALAIATRLQGMSHWVIWELSSLFENIGTVRDGINSLALNQAVIDAKDAKVLGRVEGNIAFENVNFAYGSGYDENSEKTKAVLSDMNLDIPAGRKIGLVGRSGAGKSTLVNLLLRFFDIESGTIKIDGQDIAACTQESLRANIGMVSQDTSLLHRSVRENIAYGKPDASEDEIWAAAKMAEADEFIPKLIDAKGRRGLDAQVGERGVKLSGGQRQRIAIARVLLKNAPILILDEATSALDSEVEAAIQGQLEKLMEGKTVIAIAHRLSTIAAMDHLIVLDDGKILEQGTHGDLLAQSGIYSNLWARQSGGFLTLDETDDGTTAAQ